MDAIPESVDPDSARTPVDGGWHSFARRIRALGDAVQARAVFYRLQRFDPETADECVELADTLRMLARSVEGLDDRPWEDGDDLKESWGRLSARAGDLIRPDTY